jgi:serine/threonine transporter
MMRTAGTVYDWKEDTDMKTENGLLRKIVRKYSETSLILRILIGMLIGAGLGLLVPGAEWISIPGNLFVSALKAIAPVLVFVLVISSLANGNKGFDRRFGFVIAEYLISTFIAAVVAVVFSYLFPVTMQLSTEVAANTEAAPSGIGAVLQNLLLSIFANPVSAIASGNYVSILFWAVVIGILMNRLAAEGTKTLFNDLSVICSRIVKGIINLAPFGILGLVFGSVASGGLSVYADYGKLILLLVGSMATVALIVNPLIVFLILRRNPYPLVLRCIRESGVTAFFTRSSAANIPVNMGLCERLGLEKDVYSVSIPLGATINMDGAAVVITIMTLAAVRTMGIPVDLPSAIVLSLLSTVAACGTSGVAGGSLLLIPMACSLFGISADIAMQVVGVGFIISVIQDSMETALNSSGDVIFTATAEYRHWMKNGKSLPTFLGGETKVDI